MQKMLLLVVVSVWSLAALGAEEKLEALQGDLKFFTDPSCRQLKRGVRSKDLAGFKSELLKTVAAGMLSGSYDSRYRVAAYEAYPSPRELGKDAEARRGLQPLRKHHGHLPGGGRTRGFGGEDRRASSFRC